MAAIRRSCDCRSSELALVDVLLVEDGVEPAPELAHHHSATNQVPLGDVLGAAGDGKRSVADPLQHQGFDRADVLLLIGVSLQEPFQPGHHGIDAIRVGHAPEVRQQLGITR